MDAQSNTHEQYEDAALELAIQCQEAVDRYSLPVSEVPAPVLSGESLGRVTVHLMLDDRNQPMVIDYSDSRAS